MIPVVFLTAYVPYNPAVWSEWWNAVMKTISSTTSVGFLIFGVLFCIGIFRAVLRFFM